MDKKRKLRAILFADIVGYTALMQKDEAQASQLLQKFRHTLNEKVTQHSGEIINNYGDGCLCTFESAVDAMICAKEVQLIFQTEPKVPVRIGLHSGDVFFEEDNVFGDSVNIASRIESLGVAGAVLFSKRIKRDIANQTEFKVQSLGEFHFKNVEKEMEVFALANEGLVVPQSKALAGKLKPTPASTNKWLIPALLGVIALGFIFWILNPSNEMNLQGSELENHSTPLSKEIRDKRVAVMVFDNQTNSENLENFGLMISDWLTKGLMETGEAKVISAANIQNKAMVAKAGATLTTLAKETGVGVLVQGRYYLQENQLIIHANIVDAEKGEVIHALDPIQGEKAQMVDLLEGLTQKVLGYWSVRKQSRFLQNPPKYEAYQKYLEANNTWYQAAYFEEQEQLLKEAYRLDTTFYEPLLKLAILYRNTSTVTSLRNRDSIVQFIEAKHPPLTKWEHLRLQAVKEDFGLKAAQINEQMYALDASDGAGNFNAAFHYLIANRPHKTVELLTDFNPQFRNWEATFSWREPRLTTAYWNLGEYEKVIEVAENYALPKTIYDLACTHLWALVTLDSLDQIAPVYEKYLEKGILSGSGNPADADRLLSCLCEIFYLKDKKELLEQYSNQLEKWIINHPDIPNYNNRLSQVAFYRRDYKKAISFLEQQKIAPNSYRRYIDQLGYLGANYALQGNTTLAEKQLARLDKLGFTDQPTNLKQRCLYTQAKILASLNRPTEAIQKLQLAEKEGMPFMFLGLGKNDVFLKPLFGNPEFEKLVKPKE